MGSRTFLRILISIFLTLSVFCAGLPHLAAAQSGQPDLPPIIGEIKVDGANVVASTSTRPRSTIPGLQYDLEQIYRAAESKDKAALEGFSGMQFVDVENSQARVILEMETSATIKQTGAAWVETVRGGDGKTVEIYHPAAVSVRADLEMGLKLAGADLEAATDTSVQVLAPFSSLKALAGLPGVRLVRLPYPSRQMVGTQTSQGVSLTRADVWQAAGADGTGVIVGVFDFGFTGWAGLQTSGDLPSGGQLVAKDYSAGYSFSPDTGGMEHGAGCAEIVYDMAPGSTIYMYAFSTEVELSNAVSDLMGVSGNRVASMSIGWVNAGPYDGTGPVNDIISLAKNDGILWFTSMGNNQATHWSGTSAQYSGSDTVAFGTGNLNGLGSTPGSVWNLPAGSQISLYLSWNDWNAARTGNQSHIDYDILLYRWTGSSWSNVDGSYGDQCGTSTAPTESINYTVPTTGGYALAIVRYTSGGACPNNFGHWMNLHSFYSIYQPGTGAANLFWYNNHCNSILIPADSSDNLAVGATYWGEDSTASLYGLETFSSLGPRSAAGGANPGTTVNKPDVVAPDGVSNVTYGANSGTNYANGGAGFWGTSAAAPHAAGLAATIWEHHSTYTLSQMSSLITSNAMYKADGGTCGGSKCETESTDIKSVTQNNRYGWGRIHLYNNAPALDNSGTMSLTAINEDDISNSGTLVSSIISSAGGDRITDADPGAVEGIAVTAADNTYGEWEYSTNGGSSWSAFGTPSNASARLLASNSNTRIRFVPDANRNGTIDPGITFRAWDQTSGSAGNTADTTSNGGTTAFSAIIETASITINPFNDAPVLDSSGTMSLTAINEDDTTNSGTLVSSIITSAGGDRITDVDAGAVEGIAVTAVDNANGAWQYSTNGGSSWSNFGTPSPGAARLLASNSNTRIRFVPNANWNGAVTNGITFRAWDQTSGSAGNTADTTTNGGTTAFSTATESAGITVSALNDAPVLDASAMMNLTAINEDDVTNSGTQVSSIISSAGGDRITDVDSGAVEGIAITALDTTHGTWQFTTNGGSNWTTISAVSDSNALLLQADLGTHRVRFVPTTNWNGAVTNGITFRAWDQTSGSAGTYANATTNGGTTAFSSANENASITVNPLNDAPVLDNSGSMILAAINEDDTTNSGTLLSGILSSAGGDRITDVDTGAVEGIAVTEVDNTFGAWEYSLNGGSSWSAFGAPSENSARLLAADANTRVRFVPNADQNGTIDPGITFRAWDQTSGSAGSTADVTSNGGTTAFSAAKESATISITPVNDAPVLDSSASMILDAIYEDDVDNSGTLVTTIIASAGGDRITDADAGAMEGIAVTAVDNTNGSWQYTLDGNTWNDFGTPSSSAARLLAADTNTKVRFVPNTHWNGTVMDGIVFQAWDQTSGSVGNTADTTTNGGTTAFSTATESAGITVNPLNSAPVLDASGEMSLAAIDEDDMANSGTLVTAIIASAGGDRITDVDAGAMEGIAVTAVDNTNGTWQYTLDGSTWNDFGTPSSSAARLLAANANTKVRFVPDADWYGTVTGGITFQAWDQTSGSAGSTADVTTNGGTTAFSTASESAGITINPVNDAPELDAIGNKTVKRGETLSFTASASDIEGHSLTFSLDPGGPDDDTIDAVTGVYTWVTDSGDTPGDFTVTVRVTDNGSPNEDGFETITVTLEPSESYIYLPMVSR